MSTLREEFEAWYFEIENASMRCERLHQMELIDSTEAAFNAGYRAATEKAAKLAEDARDAAPVYRDEYDICNELAAAIRGDGGGQ